MTSFPSDAPSAEARLNALLAGQSDVSIATAESCTGGRVAHRITSIAGSSDYFLGGIVAYANSAKAGLLGVPAAILDNPGAVSEPCARSMAEGARARYGATYAVSTTGIAGPGGGTARKPVGLVYIALATPGDTVCEEHVFSGDRATVVESAAEFALRLLLDAIERDCATGAIPAKQAT